MLKANLSAYIPRILVSWLKSVINSVFIVSAEMIFSQKRLCGNCRALDYARARCDLGYKIKNARDISSPDYLTAKYIPLEPCPKPLTMREYLEELRGF